jgi:hypothetical protein
MTVSDRLCLLPYKDISVDDPKYMDVVIPVGASAEAFRAAVDKWSGMMGPHRLIVARKDDPRIALVEEMASDYAAFGNFSVWTPGDFAECEGVGR